MVSIRFNLHAGLIHVDGRRSGVRTKKKETPITTKWVAIC